MSPSGLYIERNSAGHYLLRFANTAGNVGGRLEISVAPGSREIYQNVYDQNVGGNRVIHERVQSDLIYHPQHNHFHFAGFAQYELLKKNSAGSYDVTARAGSKTTFCILDTVRLNSSGPTYPTYNSCGANFQGMSAGWGDTYVAALFDQWIDVGKTPLADGSYAIRSTADPDNRLMETNDFNNAAITYFSIETGRPKIDSTPPLCTVQGAAGSVNAMHDPAAVAVGSVVRLACSQFQDGETVDIYWGSVNTPAKASATASSNGTFSTFVEIPPSSLGVHYWIAKGRSSGSQAAVIVNTIPSVSISPERGEVGSGATATIRGFSSGEDVEIRFFKAGTVVAASETITASSSGSGSVDFDVPAVPFGAHEVQAVGEQSGAMATGSFMTVPSIDLTSDEAEFGDLVSANLRGFAAGEAVVITLGPQKIEIGEFIASHSGSGSPSTTRMTIPDVTPGDYMVYATGSISGVTASDELRITVSNSSTDPVETATSTPESAATETVTATATVENASPVAVAGDDQSLVDLDGSGTEVVNLVGSSSYDPDGGPLTAEWMIDETVISTEIDTDLALSVGSHTLVLVVSDVAGATGIDEVVIVISAVENPTVTAAASPGP